MTTFADVPKCELCETESNLQCVSVDYSLYLCVKCRDKMSYYWEKRQK